MKKRYVIPTIFAFIGLVLLLSSGLLRTSQTETRKEFIASAQKEGVDPVIINLFLEQIDRNNLVPLQGLEETKTGFKKRFDPNQPRLSPIEISISYDGIVKLTDGRYVEIVYPQKVDI